MVPNWLLFALLAGLATAAAAHALLTKREPRSALAWIGVCLLFPLLGPLLYFLFGINRVHTRARKLRRQASAPQTPSDPTPQSQASPPPEFADLDQVSKAVTGLPLVGGNRVDFLQNGEAAYPAMLEAIDCARESVYLSTYILESNHTGKLFIDALARATKRGVDVRVMIDGIGELYSLPRASRLLRKQGVRVARFLPPKLFPPALHLNLRNHRKILVTDHRLGFTGGMNIGDRHLAESNKNPARVVDAQFRFEGPIVRQIEEVFLEDWEFVTGDFDSDKIEMPAETGTAACRAIVDGPNEDLGKLNMVLLGAIATARRRISIMTPYFLPPTELVAGLQAAALRGVDVEIILPGRNNLFYMHWATRKVLPDLLERGVQVWYQPAPFVHTKLFLVDDHYAQIGSANFDARSLRLNFELVAEIYDRTFVGTLADHFRTTRERSTPVTLEELSNAPLAVKIRDGLSWLFSPYL